MCLLLFSKKQTEKRTIRKLFPNKKTTAKCYKLLRVKYGSLQSMVCYHVWTIGENISRRIEKEMTNDEIVMRQIYCGIHVFLNRPHWKSMGIIVPVYCKKKDLVNTGRYGEAVFTKVTLRKRDYERAIKKYQNS